MRERRARSRRLSWKEAPKDNARRNRPACTGGRTLDKCGNANAQCEAFDLEEHRGAVCGCLLVKQYIIIDCR